MAVEVAISPTAFATMEQHIDALSGAAGEADCQESARELLTIGEMALERWIEARGEVPTRERREGFRILALHRQGAKGEPSFNACRETCRELAYHYNLITMEPGHPESGKRVRMAAMVAKHLVLFIGGKLEVAGLGDFCCAAKPVRGNERLDS